MTFDGECLSRRNTPEVRFICNIDMVIDAGYGEWRYDRCGVVKYEFIQNIRS